MRTSDLLNVYEYDALGGPVKAVPTGDVLRFVVRIQNRLEDIKDNPHAEAYFAKELMDVAVKMGMPRHHAYKSTVIAYVGEVHEGRRLTDKELRQKAKDDPTLEFDEATYNLYRILD